MEKCHLKVNQNVNFMKNMFLKVLRYFDNSVTKVCEHISDSETILAR